MNNAALLTELNVRLGDSDNFTFTSDEKSSALTEATNDTYVNEEAYDSSLTYTSTTWQYTIPTGVTNVQELEMSYSGSTDAPQRVPKDAWEIVNGKIHIDRNYRDILSEGATIYVKGLNKITTSDTVTNVGLQEYILNLTPNKNK